MSEKERMTVKEAAEYLKIHPRTLNNWRSRGESNQPSYYKIGRLVFYLKKDLDKFIEKNRYVA